MAAVSRKKPRRSSALVITPEQIRDAEQRDDVRADSTQFNRVEFLAEITAIKVGKTTWSDYAKTGITGAEIERVLARQWGRDGIKTDHGIGRIVDGRACLWINPTGGDMILDADTPPDLTGRELYDTIRAHYGLTEPADQMTPATPKRADAAGGPARLIESRRDIPISVIDDSPWQTRAEPTAEAIAELAGSLRTTGLLRPIRVRCLNGGKRYELIGGHRRLRAARSLGWTTIIADIVEADDATAAREVYEDNRQQPLNDIERAKGLKAMWAVYTAEGRSQRQLAADVGLSQGAVSNLIRLLDAPEALQQRVIAGDIAQTQLRSILTWVERPAVMESFVKELNNRCKSGPIEQHHWRSALSIAIERNSRPVTKSAGYQTPNEPLFDCSKHEAELDVIEYREESFGGSSRTVRRAFNVARWKQLQAEAQKKQAEREQKKQAKAASKGQKTNGKAAPAVVRTNTNDWQFRGAWRAAIHDVQWIAIRDAVTSKKLPKSDRSRAARLVLFLDVDHSDIDSLIKANDANYVIECFRLIKVNWPERCPIHDLEVDVLFSLSDQFSCNILTTWRPTRSLLERTARADLEDFAAELETVSSEAVTIANDAQLIDLLLANWRAGFMPDLYAIRIESGSSND